MVQESYSQASSLLASVIFSLYAKNVNGFSGRTEMRVSALSCRSSYDEQSLLAWPTRLIVVQKLDHSKEHNNTTKYPDQEGNLWCWARGVVRM